jgi:hypothetical protein
MRLRLLLLSAVSLVVSMSARAVDESPEKPVAVIFGESVYAKDLVAPGGAKPVMGRAADAASAERARGEMLRARVWKAVFEDYARRRHIAPTDAEIVSQIEGHQRMKVRMDAERVQQRAALIEELKSPSLTETRRKAAQQHLDTLNRLVEFDAKRAQELRDPAQRKMQQDPERRVAEYWVRAWKVNQALYREFGGRIIFQQAGWEPIDAYRKLLDQAGAKKAFVVHDPVLHAAVYSYFEHRFVYADETKARFYFEKPYWERTPEEMKAAGF